MAADRPVRDRGAARPHARDGDPGAHMAGPSPPRRPRRPPSRSTRPTPSKESSALARPIGRTRSESTASQSSPSKTRGSECRTSRRWTGLLWWTSNQSSIPVMSAERVGRASEQPPRPYRHARTVATWARFGSDDHTSQARMVAARGFSQIRPSHGANRLSSPNRIRTRAATLRGRPGMSVSCHRIRLACSAGIRTGWTVRPVHTGCPVCWGGWAVGWATGRRAGDHSVTPTSAVDARPAGDRRWTPPTA